MRSRQSRFPLQRRSEINNQPQEATVFLDADQSPPVMTAKLPDGSFVSLQNGGSGSGDVTGPDQSVENMIPVYADDTGKVIAETLVFIETSGTTTGVSFEKQSEGQGQDVNLISSDASGGSDANGGRIQLKAGAGDGNGNGGHAQVSSGDSTNGDAGDIILTPGFSDINGIGNIVVENKELDQAVVKLGNQGVTLIGTSRAVNFNNGSENISLKPPETMVSSYELLLPEYPGNDGDILVVKDENTGQTEWKTGITRYTVATDVTHKETDGVTALTDLDVPVLANRKYKIRYYIATTAAGAQPTYQLYCNYPSGYLTVDWGPSSPNDLLNNYTTRTPANNTVGLFVLSTTTGTSGSNSFYAILQNGPNDGTLAFRWLSKSSGDADTTIYAGSFVEVEDIT